MRAQVIAFNVRTNEIIFITASCGEYQTRVFIRTRAHIVILETSWLRRRRIAIPSNGCVTSPGCRELFATLTLCLVSSHRSGIVWEASKGIYGRTIDITDSMVVRGVSV